VNKKNSLRDATCRHEEWMDTGMAFPKAVLFDMDGVLVDSEPVHELVRRQLFAEMNGGRNLPVPKATIGAIMAGEYQLLLDACGATGDAEALARKHFFLARDYLCQHGAGAIPGVREALCRLAEVGVSCAVISSSDRDFVDGVLSDIGLTPYFRFTICGDDGIRIKPAPDPYLAGLAKLGCPAADALVVEDSHTGLLSATAAGIRCVCYDNRSATRQDFTGAYRVVTDMHKLTDALVQATEESAL